MRRRLRPPNATKPTKPGGEVGSGEADKTINGSSNSTPDDAVPQWMHATSRTLTALVFAFRKANPSRPLPVWLQRALANEWGAA
jgi:hypothetical protein